MRATAVVWREWLLPLACVVGLWLTGARAGAEERRAVAPPPEAVAEADTAADPGWARLGGLEIAIDPETGRLVPPSAEQARAMARELRRILAGPAARAESHDQDASRTPVVAGSRGVVVAPRVVQWTVARIGTGGAPSAACVHGVEGAERALTLETSEDEETGRER